MSKKFSKSISSHSTFVEILSTFNPGDVAFIKSLLDNANIKYYFKGENFLQVRPMILPARLMVPKNQIQEVKDILKDIKLTWTAVSVRKSIV